MSKGAKTGTEGLIGPSLGPMKDIQTESTCDNLDSFAQTNIPSFSNTASYVVMPLQSPTNGAYHPISTACHGAFSSGGVSYSAPYGTVGLPTPPWGFSETHEQQGVLSTNCLHSTGLEIKGNSKCRNYCTTTIASIFFVYIACHTWIIKFPFVGHQSTILGNGPSPSISYAAHVSMYQVHTHLSMQQSTKSTIQTMMWCF